MCGRLSGQRLGTCAGLPHSQRRTDQRDERLGHLPDRPWERPSQCGVRPKPGTRGEDPGRNCGYDAGEQGYLNPAAFCANSPTSLPCPDPVAPGAYGNLQRNAVNGPMFFQFDSQLSHLWPIGERFKMDTAWKPSTSSTTRTSPIQVRATRLEAHSAPLPVQPAVQVWRIFRP